MKFVRNIDKTLKKTLKTKHLRLISSIILICVIFATLKGTSNFFLILNNPILKISITLMIIYISTWDIRSAIILFIVYILILHSINKINVDTFIGTPVFSIDSLKKLTDTNKKIINFITKINNKLTQAPPTVPASFISSPVVTSTHITAAERTFVPTPDPHATEATATPV